MATEVLRPQDCLTERFGVVTNSAFNRRRNIGNGYFTPRTTTSYYNTRKQVVRTEKILEKKRLLNNTSKRSPTSAEELRPSQTDGRITILRRGESMGSLNQNDRFAPTKNNNDELTMVPKPIRAVRSSPDMYAGSGFSISPSPRSLPLPSFFNKKQQEEEEGLNSFDDFATRDLRRLLRLE